MLLSAPPLGTIFSPKHRRLRVPLCRRCLSARQPQLALSVASLGDLSVVHGGSVSPQSCCALETLFTSPFIPCPLSSEHVCP